MLAQGVSPLRCPGSGKLCREASAANAQRARERTQAALGNLQTVALALHDALHDERQISAHEIEAMRKYALRAYRLRFPGERPRRNRLWFTLGRGGRRLSRYRSGWTANRVDVYCTLCRVVLLPNMFRGADYTERTREHTTLCALRCLAGITEYVDPKERRAPPSELAEDPAADEGATS